ncbi:MAG TPA: alpha/beta fold hydrolase [Vampirovibrionales bacterium]
MNQKSHSNFINSKQLSIYLESTLDSISSQEKENKSTKNLVAVHGLGTCSAWYDDLKEKLLQNNIDLTTFDLPGFGQTTGNGVEKGIIKSYKQWVEALKTTWDKVHEQQNSGNSSFLLGHSLGGVVSLASLKELNPKPKGIILTVPAFMAHPDSWPLFTFVVPTFFKALINSPNKMDFPMPAEVEEMLVKKPELVNLMTSQVRPKLFLESLKATITAWLNLNELKDIPFYLVVSRSDKTCSPEAAENFFNMCNAKDKQLKVFENTGHDLFILPEADELNQLIANWIIEKS